MFGEGGSPGQRTRRGPPRPGHRVVAGQLAGSCEERGRLVGRRQVSEDSGHPIVGRGCRGQIQAAARYLRRAERRLRRPARAAGVVAAHPASGHVRRGPEGGSRASRVVGEAGRLLVPLLGLTREVPREGQVRKGQGQVARLDAASVRPLPSPGRPGTHRPPHRTWPASHRWRATGPGQARWRWPGTSTGGEPCRGELAGLGELLGPVLARIVQRPARVPPTDAATVSRLCSASRASPSTTSPGSRGENGRPGGGRGGGRRRRRPAAAGSGPDG